MLAMEPEGGPSVKAFAGWAFDALDPAETRGEASEKVSCFFRRKRLAHVRVVECLHAGVIACVEQINNLSSDGGVAVGFLEVNDLRGRLRGRCGGFASFVLGQVEHQKEPNANKSDFAPKSELPKGDFEFGRFNARGSG